MGNEISHGQTLREVPSEHQLSAASIAQYSYPIGRLVPTPMYPVGRPISPTTPLSADWSSPKPYCQPTVHHPSISRRPPHQPHHFTVGRLVPTPMYPVGRPINPITPLLADWSSPKTHHRPTGDPSNVPCQPPHHPTAGRPISPQRHCWPTGPNSNVPCRPTGHHPKQTVGQLVITLMYPVGRPISPTTPLSADRSSPQHTPSAAPSAPPPHCRPTGHHPKQTIGQLVITQNKPSADWSSPQHTPSAAPSAPPPHCRPTGHHPNIPRWPPHQPHHPTVGQLVVTPMYPVSRPVTSAIVVRSAASAELLLTPIMSHPLTGQSPEK